MFVMRVISPIRHPPTPTPTHFVCVWKKKMETADDRISLSMCLSVSIPFFRVFPNFHPHNRWDGPPVRKRPCGINTCVSREICVRDKKNWNSLVSVRFQSFPDAVLLTPLCQNIGNLTSYIRRWMRVIPFLFHQRSTPSQINKRKEIWNARAIFENPDESGCLKNLQQPSYRGNVPCAPLYIMIPSVWRRPPTLFSFLILFYTRHNQPEAS
jgi:hypothetical protein